MGLLYRRQEETDQELQMWLHVDRDRFSKGTEHWGREDRVCLVCMSVLIEDEHHLQFDCHP